MSVDQYKDSLIYEYFIRHAHNCLRGMRNGADACFMKNAMSMESGETFAKHLGSFQKQFSVVKGYIKKALEKALKNKSYRDSHSFFNAALEDCDSADTTSALMDIVTASFEEIKKYKSQECEK